MLKIHDILKQILDRENISIYRIAKDLGLDYGSAHRLVNDGGNPTWKTVGRVLDYLGYEIRVVKSSRSGGRKGRK